jgi:hypothetical protein
MKYHNEPPHFFVQLIYTIRNNFEGGAQEKESVRGIQTHPFHDNKPTLEMRALIPSWLKVPPLNTVALGLCF